MSPLLSEKTEAGPVALARMKGEQALEPLLVSGAFCFAFKYVTWCVDCLS